MRFVNPDRHLIVQYEPKAGAAELVAIYGSSKRSAKPSNDESPVDVAESKPVVVRVRMLQSRTSWRT
jgi:hypothetical protein